MNGYIPLAQADALRHLPVLDARIERTGGCWVWTGYRNVGGYGRVSINGKLLLVHRIVYTALVGPIPEGLTLDHLCRNTSCVNPAHLEPVTLRVNTRRSDRTRASINAARTHCPQGHPYDEANTRWWGGGRFCRTCERGTPVKRGTTAMTPALAAAVREATGSQRQIAARFRVSQSHVGRIRRGEYWAITGKLLDGAETPR